MNLVTYSDSDSDSDHDSSPSLPLSRKRKQPGSELPPLPPSFHNLYASQVRSGTSDDPALHNGRKRVTPHIEGNWPSHVFIEWLPQPEDMKTLELVLERHHDECVHSLMRSDLGVPLPLHISLSQSLNLGTDQRGPFVERLRDHLNQANVASFEARLQEPKWAANFSETRHFLVLPVEAGSLGPLSKLLAAANATADEFKLPLLYAPARESHVSCGADSMHSKPDPDTSPCTKFHVSIAWSLRAPETIHEEMHLGLSKYHSSSPTRFQTWALRDLARLQDVRMRVESIKVKIGNNITELELNS